MLPGHSEVRSLLKSATTSKNAPSLNYVSDKKLLSPCSPYLFKYPNHYNPDRQVWLDSYKNEEHGLIYHEVYEKTSKIQYLALKREGKTPKATPSMCVLIVKNNKYGKPLCAKSCIVVLGNFKDQLYQRSQRYALFLKYSSLHLLTAKSVGDKRILQ